jgi:hypothetical protein
VGGTARPSDQPPVPGPLSSHVPEQSFKVTMRSHPGATGRPDELLAELGFEPAPRRIVRQALIFTPLSEIP